MIPILTPDQASALDRASAERGVGVEALMERAGFAVARAAARLAGGTYGRRAMVLCGKGNNGGDGLVAARHLQRWGMGVSVLLLASPSAYRGAAAAALASYAAADGRWIRFDAGALAREARRAHVAVDAIFGTGFRGGAEGAYAEAIDGLPAARAVLSVDIPSGVDGSTGAANGPAVGADATVTFGALKPGVVFDPGATLAGRVQVADIGFPPNLIHPDAWMVEPADAAVLVPVRPTDAHKRSTGVVLVVAGSRDMTGAPVLAASAAYRAGAGLVMLAAPRSALAVAQRALVEAVFVPLPETDAGTMAAGAVEVVAERFGGVHALAVGPGLSTHPETAAAVRRMVAASPVPVVLDADGLNAFSAQGVGSVELRELSGRPVDLVATPHAGEFARLTGVAAGDLDADRMGHARKAAADLRAIVLLKGPRTVVADPSGLVRVNPTGGPALATAGTGDVLTGAIAALVARGLEPADAAVLGAFVHGLAGSAAGADLGEGATATDVLARLPQAMADLRAGHVEVRGFPYWDRVDDGKDD